MSRFLNERVLVLLALLLVAAALYASSFAQTFSDVGSAHSPVFFPRIVLVLWMGLAVIALAQVLMQGYEAQPIHGIWRLAVLVLVLATVVYTNLVTKYGFFLTSAGFAVVCLGVFGLRNPLVVLAYAVAVPGALVLLFNHSLGMPLPTSPFTYYF
jgi:hypothetical protein